MFVDRAGHDQPRARLRSAAAAVSGVSWRSVKAAAPFVPLLGYNMMLWALIRDRSRFPDSADYPFVATLEEHWPLVQAELEELLAHGPPIPRFETLEPQQAELWRKVSRVLGRVRGQQVDPAALEAKTRGWKMFVFRMYGMDVAPNREQCPKTAAVLDEIPGLLLAMFSVLEPGTRLPGHVGLFKGVLRCHLGVRVPEGQDCAIRVGGQTHYWEEGRAFVFDDTYWHSAWNEGSESRVVLLLDFERPMPWPWLARLNHQLIEMLPRTGKSQEAIRNLENVAREGNAFGHSESPV